MIVKTKVLPESLKKAVKSISRKQSVIITDYPTKETPFASSWQGGSKARYFIASLVTGAIREITQESSAFCNPHLIRETMPIDVSMVAISCGTFCGKPSTPSISFRSQEDIDSFKKEIA